MRPPDDNAGLVALLHWYGAMGVDAAVADQPVDWLCRGEADFAAGIPDSRTRDHAGGPGGQNDSDSRAGTAAGPSARRQTAGAAGRPQTPANLKHPDPRSFSAKAPDTAETAARAAAHQARSLVDLEAALARFDGCGLKATAKNLCFYRGAQQARVLIIGEAPGREEDLEGKPFVGRAGQLLDRMLAAAGLGEANTHITNIVYWRPPGNRTPTPQEAQVCRPFLERQVALVAPEVVVLLGGAAAKHILDVAEGIMRIRGKWKDVVLGGHSCKAIATLHPAYLLRTPAAKRTAWRDLLAIRTELDGG